MNTMEESFRLSKFIAVCYYLKELRKKNLVAPSIGQTYPCTPVTKEKMMIHAANLEVQSERIIQMENDIRT